MPRRPARAAAKPKSDTITEEDVNAALSILKRDYYQDVRGICDDLEREIKDGEITSGEQLNERISESVDGSARVIYTFQAKIGLICTDNEDAWEDMGFENPTPEQKMFCAMEQDVRDMIGDPDFDD